MRSGSLTGKYLPPSPPRHFGPHVVALALGIASCAPVDTPAASTAGHANATTSSAASTQSAAGELTVLTHDSFSISDEVLADFENETGIDVQFLAGGDTGVLVNKAVLARGNPAADVLYGVDNTFLSRALDEGIFAPYESPALENIPDEFELDPENRALPVDYDDVCANYDIAWFEDEGLGVPESLEALAEPAYRSLTVVENPATSSPGLAFLLATIAQYGEDGYLDYWTRLKDNDVLVVNDWETAYNQEFTRAGGQRPIVVSYASSPAFEALYAEETPVPGAAATAPTEALTVPGACFRQTEFVGILDGAEHRAAAEAWIDFMLSRRFQEDIPEQMFVFPVLPDAELDPVFDALLDTPEPGPRTLSPDQIAAGRESWVKAWTEAVLR
jgi:thiamine transport system substrate-binding protein